MVTQVVIGKKTSGRTAWLSPGAAASYNRMLRAGMPPGNITDAGRTYSEQKAMYEAYLRGDLSATAARPGTSTHETGDALDINTASATQSWLLRNGREHGWIRTLALARRPEPWHWQWNARLDKHINDQEEEDEMPVVVSCPSYGFALLDGGRLIGIGDMATVYAARGAGCKDMHVTDADFVRMQTQTAPGILLFNDAKSGNRGYAYMVGGTAKGVGDINLVNALRAQGCPTVNVRLDDFERFLS